MGIYSAIRNYIYRRPPAGRGRGYNRRIRAKYDAAQTTEDNRKHWAAADELSSVRANSAEVRRTLRKRSRYEVSNNCYARGILNTIAAYTVGAGPTLQLTYRGREQEPDTLRELRQAAQEVEQQWAIWAAERKLTQKLTAAVLAVYQDGESFGMLATSPKPSMKTPVRLNVRLYEADQFDDPVAEWFSLDDSGVQLDSSGEPTAYSMLNSHPGDAVTVGDLSAQWVPADQVLHVFRRERAGQLRGIPATTPALPLFAVLRRFTLATLTAAETAADFAAIVYGMQPPDTEEQYYVTAWDRIEIERGALTSLPAESSLAQLKAEHPNATYDEFVRAVLREIARCMSVPAVIALGDASNYNYASGRLDLQSFSRQMAADRAQYLESDFLGRIWQEWLDEALLIDGFLPAAFTDSAGDWCVGWRWSEPEHVDRAKEATGQATELANGTTTLAIEYARRGLDWEEQRRQRYRELARERELAAEFGVEPEPVPTTEQTGANNAEQTDAEEAPAQD